MNGRVYSGYYTLIFIVLSHIKYNIAPLAGNNLIFCNFT